MRLRYIGLLLWVVASLAIAAPYQGIVLKRAPKVGDITKLRLKAEATIDGSAVVMSGLVVETVTKVEENGDFVVVSASQENKVDYKGSTSSPGNTSTTSTIKSTGEVALIVSEVAEPSLYRIANLTALRFPSQALKVGDSWSVTIAKDERGSVDAQGTYKVEAQEKIGEYDTYRIAGSLKESSGDKAASMDATYWINIKDGSVVKMTGTLANAPYPNISPLTLKITLARE